MQGLLILILVAGIGYLGYDDYSKRGELIRLRDQVARSAAAAAAAPVRQPPANRASGTAPAVSSWWKERSTERPALDSAVRPKDPLRYSTPGPGHG